MLTKKAGGLGVLDLRMQNRALLNICSNSSITKDIPWVNLIWNNYYDNGELQIFPIVVGSFWWRDCCSIIQDFKNMTICVAGSGSTISLLYEKWR